MLPPETWNLEPWNLGTSTISRPRRGTWNLGTLNLHNLTAPPWNLEPRKPDTSFFPPADMTVLVNKDMLYSQ